MGNLDDTTCNLARLHGFEGLTLIIIIKVIPATVKWKTM